MSFQVIAGEDPSLSSGALAGEPDREAPRPSASPAVGADEPADEATDESLLMAGRDNNDSNNKEERVIDISEEEQLHLQVQLLSSRLRWWRGAALLLALLLAVVALLFATVRIQPPSPEWENHPRVIDAHPLPHQPAPHTPPTPPASSTPLPAAMSGPPAGPAPSATLMRSCAASSLPGAAAFTVNVYDPSDRSFWLAPSDARTLIDRVNTQSRIFPVRWKRADAVDGGDNHGDTLVVDSTFPPTQLVRGSDITSDAPLLQDARFYVQLQLSGGSLSASSAPVYLLVPLASTNGRLTRARSGLSSSGMPLTLDPLLDSPGADPTQLPHGLPVDTNMEHIPQEFKIHTQTLKFDTDSAKPTSAQDNTNCVWASSLPPNPFTAHLSAFLSSPLVNPLSTLMCSTSPSSASASALAAVVAPPAFNLSGPIAAYLSSQPPLQRRHLAATSSGFEQLGLAPEGIQQLADLAVWYTVASVPAEILNKLAGQGANNLPNNRNLTLQLQTSSASPPTTRPLSLPHCTPQFLRTSVMSGARALRERSATFDEQVPLRGNSLKPFWMLTPTELEAPGTPVAPPPPPADASSAPASTSSSDLPPPSPVWSWSFRFGFSDCYLSPFSSSSALDCLLGRKLFFRGDSLTRYQFLSLAWFLHFGEWPESFLGSDTEGPNVTDEHEFPTTTPSPEFEGVGAGEKQWRNFFSYLRVVFGSAISVRDAVDSGSKLELLLYRHPVLDIEVGLKTSYTMPMSNPPWDEWKADFEVYAPRTQWEVNRATRVRRYTEQYRLLTRQQRREARRKQTQECSATEEQPRTEAPSSSSSPSPLLPPLPALSPLASSTDLASGSTSGSCDSPSWCPDVVLLNHGLHNGNLPEPSAFTPTHPVIVSFQALMDGWASHYPRALFVWKTTTSKHGPEGSDTHAPHPDLHANELKYMRIVESAAAKGAHAMVLDAYQIVSALLTTRDSSDGTFPVAMNIAPYWDPWHPWPFIHEAINTVMLRSLCQRRGDMEQTDALTNEGDAAGQINTFEERFVMRV